jgi:hypothetical protein
VPGVVSGRGPTSLRPNAPGCVDVKVRDGCCVRAYETARDSGATRCVGTALAGTLASTMLGPRVIVYAVGGVDATLGLAGTYGRVRGAMRFMRAGGAMCVRRCGEKT